MGLDYLSGRRRLTIEEAFQPTSAQEYADRLAETLSRLLRQDTAAWHFSSYAPQFFTGDIPGSAATRHSARSV